MQAILAELQLRERVLLLLDMVTGLRRSELTATKWEDIDIEKLEIHVQRSVVEQVVGRCKTEAFRKVARYMATKSIPLDELAQYSTSSSDGGPSLETGLAFESTYWHERVMPSFRPVAIGVTTGAAPPISSYKPNPASAP